MKTSAWLGGTYLLQQWHGLGRGVGQVAGFSGSLLVLASAEAPPSPMSVHEPNRRSLARGAERGETTCTTRCKLHRQLSEMRQLTQVTPRRAHHGRTTLQRPGWGPDWNHSRTVILHCLSAFPLLPPSSTRSSTAAARNIVGVLTNQALELSLGTRVWRFCGKSKTKPVAPFLLAVDLLPALTPTYAMSSTC